MYGMSETTKQPAWKFVANLGDSTPLDYGGYFVYADATGVYGPEAELLEEPADDAADDDAATYTVRRVLLEQCKRIETPDRILLVPFAYDATWTHAVVDYDEWFSRDLAAVAECAGIELAELRDLFCSADPLQLARAYRQLGEYHGWDNLDSYPSTLTAAEVRARYTQGELAR